MPVFFWESDPAVLLAYDRLTAPALPDRRPEPVPREPHRDSGSGYPGDEAGREGDG